MKSRLQLLAAFSPSASRATSARASSSTAARWSNATPPCAPGLGFRGKNTNLLTPIGSYVFLGALLTDVELDFDQPVQKDCGTLPPVHRRLPDRCAGRGLPPGRRALHRLPDHRAPRPDRRRAAARSWASGSSAATSARRCARTTPRRAADRAAGPSSSRATGTRLDLDAGAGARRRRVSRDVPRLADQARQTPRPCAERGAGARQSRRRREPPGARATAAADGPRAAGAGRGRVGAQAAAVDARSDCSAC